MEKRIEETRSEITSKLKKEILEVKKQMEKCIEETRAEIISEIEKHMSKQTESKLREQLQKSREENR